MYGTTEKQRQAANRRDIAQFNAARLAFFSIHDVKRENSCSTRGRGGTLGKFWIRGRLGCRGWIVQASVERRHNQR